VRVDLLHLLQHVAQVVDLQHHVHGGVEAVHLRGVLVGSAQQLQMVGVDLLCRSATLVRLGHNAAVMEYQQGSQMCTTIHMAGISMFNNNDIPV
jgi:hypothetical protein